MDIPDFVVRISFAKFPELIPTYHIHQSRRRPPGLGKHKKNKDILHINEVILSNQLTPTMLIDQASKKLSLIVIEEQIQAIKERLDHLEEDSILDEWGYFHLTEVMKAGKESKVILQAMQKQENHNSSRPIIVDRGHLDALAFARSHFLYGRIKATHFQPLSDFLQVPLTFKPTTNSWISQILS